MRVARPTAVETTVARASSRRGPGRSPALRRGRVVMRGGEDGASTSGALPTLAVFDLDACFWDEEMYTLREVVDPGKNVRGSPGDDVGEGVVAAVSGRTRIRINPWALHALQNYYRGKYPGMRLAAASSADTPLAAKIGQARRRSWKFSPASPRARSSPSVGPKGSRRTYKSVARRR